MDDIELIKYGLNQTFFVFPLSVIVRIILHLLS